MSPAEFIDFFLQFDHAQLAPDGGLVEPEQILLGLIAFDQVGGLARKDVQEAEVALGRLVGATPVSGNHPEQFPVA